MPVENVTASRGYQLPDPTNQLDYDVGRIIASINGLDADVASLFASLSGKAATAHTHAIIDVSGLQEALDGKIGTGSNLPIAQVSGLEAALAAKAPLNNAAFTGTTTGVTPSAGANNTQFATTAWVAAKGYLTAVITTNIADGAVVEAKIGAGAVTNTKLADNAVGAASKIADGIITFAKMAAAAIATSAEFLANTASKILTTDKVWAAAVPVSITYAATQTFDFATFINGKITATGDMTFSTVTSAKKGQTGWLEITHSGGARAITLTSTWHQAVGGAITLTGTDGQVEKLAYLVADNGKIEWSNMGVAS